MPRAAPTTSPADGGTPVNRDTLLARGGRYTIVGAACALANNVITIGGDLLGLHYFPATLISLALVTPLGYELHSRFTFAARRSWQAFVRFTAGIAVAYPISLAMMVVLCSGLRMPVYIAMPIVTAALFVWNFLAAHWAILPRLRLRLDES